MTFREVQPLRIEFELPLAARPTRKGNETVEIELLDVLPGAAQAPADPIERQQAGPEVHARVWRPLEVRLVSRHGGASAYAPRLVGHAEYRPGTGEPSTVAVVHELVADARSRAAAGAILVSGGLAGLAFLPKATIALGGRTMLARVIERLKPHLKFPVRKRVGLHEHPRMSMPHLFTQLPGPSEQWPQCVPGPANTFPKFGLHSL